MELLRSVERRGLKVDTEDSLNGLKWPKGEGHGTGPLREVRYSTSLVFWVK